MVYRGPSSGCLTCRRRRVKCDEQTPDCGNCLKLMLECPGYKDIFERRHRNETLKIIERNGRRSPCLNTCRYKKTPLPELTHAAKASLEDPSPSEYASSLILLPSVVSLPSPDPEYLSLSFFFLAYGTSGCGEATCSLFDILPALYVRCTSHSPLSLATCALAIKITALWAQHDVDPLPARRRYAQAVTCMKKAIQDPTGNKSNELLMATLILEIYDDITASYHHGPRASVHLPGSTALLTHRGELNYRDDMSRRMMLAARNKIASDALFNRRKLPESPFLFNQAGEPMPTNPAIEVDRLGLRVSQLLKALRPDSQTTTAVHGAEEEWKCSLLSQAVSLAADCIQWIDSLPCHWHPVEVDGDNVAGSIKAAGLYGVSCDVYTNFSIATMRNWHRLVELHALLILRQCQAYNSLHLSDSIGSRIQCVVDEICSSVPFHVGDMMEPTRPIDGATIRFPHARIPATTYLASRFIPDSISLHGRQIASSGAMAMYRVLSTIAKLAQDEGDAMYVCLRNDQSRWIATQISRLKRLLRFPLSTGKQY